MRRSKRLMAFLMSVMMVVTLVCNGHLSGGYRVYAEEEVASDTDAISEDTGDSGAVIEEVANFDNSTYVGDNYEVTLTLDSYWDSGYNATITIKNTGDTVIENWCMAFPLEQNISNIWNASIEEVHEDYFVIKNAGWNQDIAVDGSVSFGITCYEAFSVFPEYYTLLGNEVELASGDYSVAYEITEDWGEGYKALVTITNNKSVALEDWRIKFNYGDNVITQIWDAVIVNNTDGVYEISCESYNQNITAGGSVSFKFLVEPGSSDAEITEILVSEFISGGQFGSEDDISEPSDEMLFIYTILGIDTDELELYMLPSVDCYSYEIYSAVDGNEYKLVDTISEDSYMYLLDSSFAKIKMYVRGYYNKGEYVDSKEIVVEYIDGEYVIILSDTDGDGLDDSYELLFTATDPFLIDTDGNGVSDSDEDLDGDGLSNILEYEYGSLPYDVDSDNDDLSDYEEIYVYYTDPVNEDSDREGLLDGEDIALGFDPNLQDTDADGVLDCDERIMQSYTYDIVDDEKKEILSVSVELECNGLLENNVYVENMYNLDVQSSNVVGLVGVPVEIQVDSEFDTAKITFTYDESMLGDTPEENLCMMWYDEVNDKYVLLEDCVLDTENNKVKYTTTHFSMYMIVDKQVWFDTCRQDINYRESGEMVYYDIMFTVDVSGSMSGNRIKLAKTALNTFIDSMEVGDYAGIVEFSDYAYMISKLTDDRDLLKDRVNSLIASGKTNAKSGLWMSAKELVANSSNNQKMIILICDGDVKSNTNFITYALENNITVHCINVASGTSSVMEDIAYATGGGYYYAATTEDIIKRFEELQDDTIDNIDMTDTDGDGLYDVYEVNGVRISNGQVVTADPNLVDSDGDGISDYDELGGIPNQEAVYFNGDLYTCTFNHMKSHPGKADTDGDGIPDAVDENVNVKDMICVAGLEHEDFISIDKVDEYGEYAYGGRQRWWEGENEKIRESGCGAIAMANVEIYLALYNDKFYNSEICDNVIDNIVQYQFYKDYVNRRVSEAYNITLLDVTPWDMETGMCEYILKNGKELTYSVKWAKSQDDIVVNNNIIEMLNNNIPVVASYYNLLGSINEELGEGLALYRIDENYFKLYDNIYSHYYTITEVLKKYNSRKQQYIYYYKISSWGKELYIKCEDWLDDIDYTSNYLDIAIY